MCYEITRCDLPHAEVIVLETWMGCVKYAYTGHY